MIFFSVLFIFFWGLQLLLEYGLACGVISQGTEAIILTTILFAVLTLLNQKRGLVRYGLCPIKHRGKVAKELLPLLALLLLNIISICPNWHYEWTLSLLFSIAYWAFIEELLFRGFLADTIAKTFACGIKEASIMASAVFALFHAFNNNGAEIGYGVLIQVLFAFGAGMCFSALKSISHSLWPGFAIHIMWNLEAMLSTQIVAGWSVALQGVIALFCTWYGVKLLKKNERDSLA